MYTIHIQSCLQAGRPPRVCVISHKDVLGVELSFSSGYDLVAEHYIWHCEYELMPYVVVVRDMG
ncbi:hypothetical protein BPY_07750 [Bifidobacterium psychraerophilum]